MKGFAEIQLPVYGLPLPKRPIILLNIALFFGHILLSTLAALLFMHSLAGLFWPIWPAAGVTAYGLLVWGPRVIPGLFLASLLSGDFLIHLHWDINIWVAVNEILSAWFGSFLLRRFSPQWSGFQSLRHTLSYLLLFTWIPSLSSASLTALGGLFLTHAAGSIAHLVLFWSMAKAAALMNVTILLLVYLHGRSKTKLHQSTIFIIVSVVILAVVAGLFFYPYASGNLAEGAVFLLILPFLWMLANYPVKLVYPLATLSFLLALLGTSLGYGPYVYDRTLFPETMAQLVGLLLETIGLIAGAMMYERSNATTALELANRDLEQRVADRSQDLRQRNQELQIRDAFLQSVTEVNRLFAALETPDLSIVLDRFCAILVERMQLAAAWIGRAEEDTGRIEVVAKAGPLAKPLAKLQIFGWNSAGQPQSPSGKAIHEQRSLLFSSADPLFEPWKDIIKQHDMGGSIYAPFAWPDGGRGVITLYHFVEKAFPQAIIDLVERLSEDLAAFLRQRQVVRQLEDTRILQKTMLVTGDIALQAREAPIMLQQICDHLIESGLFNAAFIIRPDENGVFQALATAGKNVDWILRRRWTIDPGDVPYGQSLTSRAWRDGQHLIVQDYLKALGPQVEWYAEASANQWRAAASLPIYHLQKRWAMLNVIGDRAHLFNDEIIEVLQRITLLVGHGLDEIHLKGELLEERQRQSHLARHDALTGLANRRGFTEFLLPTMTRVHRNKLLLAVAMLDLDDFKPVNDLYGHGAGDLLLREVATRLRQSLRQSDYLARLGGDEFVLVWDNLQNREQMFPILKKIGESLAKPYFLDGLPLIHVGISAGITFYPRTETDTSDADLLLRQADHALYMAKQNKFQRACFWSIFEDDQNNERQHIQGLLREGQLILQYQPVLDLREGQIVGVEALARLDSADKAISPGDFLPFLVQDDQWRLTELVLAQIAIDWQSWSESGIEIWVSVNISPSFLASAETLKRLQKLLDDCQVPPRSLILEILESEELRSLESCAKSIRILQNQGYRVGLDDVGTGYASLLYLKELPVDEIKIDQAFVLHIGENPNDLHFLRAMLDIGISQGVEIIVEGVENQSILNVLRLMQAPMIQGYAVARPMCSKDLLLWLSTHKPFIDVREDEKFDLLQLYAEVIDYQKTLLILLNTNQDWLLQLQPWMPRHCPIQQRLSQFQASGMAAICEAHQLYLSELEKIILSLSQNSKIETYLLQYQGGKVLTQISLAMRPNNAPA